MSKLRVKAKINCNTCGCTLKRTKTINIIATTLEQAKEETKILVKRWQKNIAGQNCKICQSIIDF